MMKKHLLTASLFAASMAVLALPAIQGEIVGKNSPTSTKITQTGVQEKATVVASINEDSRVPSGVFLRGTINDWAATSDYEFFYFEEEAVDQVRYLYLTGVSMTTSDEFWIADSSWGDVDFGADYYDTVVTPNTTYQLLGGGGTLKISEDIVDMDIRVDLVDGTMVIGKNLVPTSTTEIEWVVVNVEKSGEFAETYLTQNDYDWSAAKYLKVCGNINSIDLSAIKNLTALLRLDLSETSITELPSEFMYNRTSLKKVMLPETLEKIGSYAFYGCSTLNDIDLKGVKNIEESVFSQCTALPYVNIEGVETIGRQAFYYCSNLRDVDLSSVTSIGSHAFYGCQSLKTADLSSAASVDYSAFAYCRSLSDVTFNGNLKIGDQAFCETALTEVVIPEGVSSIGGHAFYGCHKLVSASLPSTLTNMPRYCFYECENLSAVEFKSGLKTIGAGAFRGCKALTSVSIPSTVNRIDADAFNQTSITEFKCYAAVPPTAENSFIGSDMDMSRTFLYVPPFSKDFYRNTENWSNFYLMRSINEPIDYICVDRPLTINLEEEDNDVVANNPLLDLRFSSNGYNYNVGQLTATGEGTLSGRQLNVYALLASRYNFSYNQIPTLINYADKMRADNVAHVIYFSSGYYNTDWHFISLPYDVKVSDIIPSDDTYWVIRRYDSAARAAGETSSTWVNLTNSDVMEAGKGYIVSVTGGPSYVDEYGDTRTSVPYLIFSSGNSLTKNNIFRSTDVIVTLGEYESEFAHNRSWNLVGNPYPSYFDMHCLNEEFTAPVTIWNGSSYKAYSPVDDDLVLAPYESFFVQCPLNSSEITFKEEGRMHAAEGAEKYRSPAIEGKAVTAAERNVFNFNLSSNDAEDRARIVLNPEASAQYEIGRDASKFFADSRIGGEIFVNSDVLYSIDERPLGDGTATLGVRTAAEGLYTISLTGKHSTDWRVWLTDHVSGMTVDLMAEDYSFQGGASDDARFTVRFEAATTGIENVEAVDADAIVAVSDIAGVVLYEGRFADFKAPETGVYVVVADGKAHKVMIRK